MNKIHIKLFLAILCLSFFSRAVAQTYTSGDVTVVVAPVMNHDSNACASSCNVTYNITVNSSFLGDSVRIVDTLYGSLIFAGTNTTGANPWTVSALAYSNSYEDAGVPVGGGSFTFLGSTLKVVAHTDTIFINNNYPFYVANPCLYSYFSGKLYADLNNDCVYNTGDFLLMPDVIRIEDHLSGSTIPLGFESISYSSTPPISSYNVWAQVSWMTNINVYVAPYYSFIFPPSSCSPVTYSLTSLPQVDIDFPVQATSYVDVECWAGTPGNARPNRPFIMHPYVSNIGIDSVSGQLILVKDSRVAYDATLSTYPADTVHGDTLIWNYYNLTSIAGGAYWNNFMSSIYLTPNTSVNIGDTLCFHVYTAVPAMDINPSNNDYIVCLPVVNSYDPNEKEVSPKGDGPTGEIAASTPELTYTIHFQNTGTDVAYDISVIDTLSPNVDAASLKILGSSHTMLPEWIAPGVVKFKFASIYLADSFDNEPASHGYVRFTVNMHAGLAPGTQIKNKGYIYFDLNPPVITNEALNTIVHTTSVNHVAVSNVKVYPNPASDAIYIENLQDGTITILSMNGSVVLNQNITNNKTEININRLPAGVYILKTVNKDGVTTRKFVKE